MSTKIYDAYVVEGMTIDQLLDHLVKFRKTYIKDSIDFLESVLKDDKDLNFGRLTELLISVMRGGSHNPLNMESSILIVPYKGKLYIKFFVDRHMLHTGAFEKLVNKKYFKDFHYQNQTDRPKEVNSKEWEKRRRIWDGIMKRGITFAEVGLIFKLIDETNASWIVHAAIIKKNEKLRKGEANGSSKKSN
jgi:hypothetical protein